MSYDHSIREQELKNKVAQDHFAAFDSTRTIGDVDFCISIKQKGAEIFKQESLYWAEAKKGSSNIYHSIVQLILTIGKARTFDKELPPPFLGALDADKIAFIPYNDIHDIFYQNDFNWKVTPSNHETKEFKQVLEKVQLSLESKSLFFDYKKDNKELKQFIKDNFHVGSLGNTKTKIDKNNFMVIYNKWLQAVKPSISVNWDVAKKNGIIDGDFYLADILSVENVSLKEKLYVVLKATKYELNRHLDENGAFTSSSVMFNDLQVAHIQFWNKYERPPREEYWDYIVERRDLLVPQDVRERKGSFFTPRQWVELSQKYLTDYLGENWQDEYYVWDCAGGTGNLVYGLTNKYNIYVSTLDKQDVDVMHEQIDSVNKNSISGNGAYLLKDHVFQFDFLNDDFTKLPQSLQDIINDPEKRRKLVMYINPPYAEAPDRNFTKEGKVGVEQSIINKNYANLLGQANRELFTQFLIRINKEISNCILAQFSKLKILQGRHFVDFRNNFEGSLEKLFIVPADTFDNVTGQFPIGFFIWDTSIKVNFDIINADVFNSESEYLGQKTIESYTSEEYINDWIKKYRGSKNDKDIIAKFPFMGNDFQQQNIIQINHINMIYNKAAGQFLVNTGNLMPTSVYFAVRKCIKATWLNDRDQFLSPNNNWEFDLMFQSNCFVYTLFNNNIQSSFGTNHWVPFTEQEVDAKSRFESHFMTDFIAGKIKQESKTEIFKTEQISRTTPLEFSDEAKAVFDAGRALWKYYHAQPNINVNASLYDIREHFQGRNDKGKMNNKSDDATYTELIGKLRDELKVLAKKIEPKVYEYGFLKE